MLELLKKDIINLFAFPSKIKYIDFSKNLKQALYYYFAFTILLLIFSIIISCLGHLMQNDVKPFVNKTINFYEVVVIAPVLEEILFRLVLRLNKFNLTIFFIWLFIFVLYKRFIIDSNCLLVLSLMSFVFLILKKNKHKLNITQFEFKFFPLPVIIYLSCFLFGIMHLSNFGNTEILNITIILYVISKALAGFAFALLRLKFGIISSIIYHIFLNSLAYFLIS